MSEVSTAVETVTCAVSAVALEERRTLTAEAAERVVTESKLVTVVSVALTLVDICTTTRPTSSLHRLPLTTGIAEYRLSNRSARMIYSRFPRDILTKIKYTLQSFEAVSRLNEEACADRPHTMPITRSKGKSADTY